MMRIIADRGEIEKAETRFAHSLDAYSPGVVRTTIGYQSGHVVRDVKWVDLLGIWAHFGELLAVDSEGAKYWNAFGLEKPEQPVGIVCEITPPLKGINRRIAGAFVKEGQGHIGVVHRGIFTIAGGMTKDFFRKHFSSEYVSVIDGNRTSEAILVGTLGADDFAYALRDFILGVDRIKQLGRTANDF